VAVADEDRQVASTVGQPAPLTSRERVAALLVGGAFSLAGIVAIFLGRDGAGSLALVAVGALFLLVGVAEIVPAVFRVAGSEMTLRRTAGEQFILRKAEVAQALEAAGDSEGAQKVLQSVANPPEPELSLSPRVPGHARMRRMIHDFLYNWADYWGARYVSEYGPYELYVEWEDRRVLIDLEFLALTPENALIADSLTSPVLTPTAVVVTLTRAAWAYSEAVPRVERMLRSHFKVPVRTVLWGARDQYAALEIALRDLLGIPPRRDESGAATQGSAEDVPID
jgi:hypothetical protein